MRQGVLQEVPHETRVISTSQGLLPHINTWPRDQEGEAQGRGSGWGKKISSKKRASSQLGTRV